jgi:hypothetical protein
MCNHADIGFANYKSPIGMHQMGNFPTMGDFLLNICVPWVLMIKARLFSKRNKELPFLLPKVVLAVL